MTIAIFMKWLFVSFGASYIVGLLVGSVSSFFSNFTRS